jgi:site-specific DNA-methyltransferase (adenine-specific)
MTEKPLHIPMSTDDLVQAAVSRAQQSSMEAWLNKVHCGDGIELMNRMPTGSVDLIVTSPQYNLRNSSGNGLKNGSGGKWENAQLLKGYDTHDDNMPHDQYVTWQRNSLTAMMRVLREDGAIFYNHKWRVQNGLLQDRHDIIEGFPVRQIIIWKRKGGINFNPGYFLPTYEVIYLICKPHFKLAPGGNKQSDVWEIPQDKNNPHPAPFSRIRATMHPLHNSAHRAGPSNRFGHDRDCGGSRRPRLDRH